jgi:nitrate reductase alpha subunit
LNTNRDWEDGYRSRWQHDKIVRSTHGVNCTGSCSWKIYVKKRPGHLGNPADRLPTYPSRSAKP